MMWHDVSNFKIPNTSFSLSLSMDANFKAWVRRKSPCLYGLSRTGKCQHLKFRNKSRKSFTRKRHRILSAVKHRTLLYSHESFYSTLSLSHTHKSFCHNFTQSHFSGLREGGFIVIYIYIQSHFFCTTMSLFLHTEQHKKREKK